MKIILASASPRRKELLEKMGFSPIISPTDADETVKQKLPPNEYVKLLSKRKSDAYTKALAEDEILISSDTVVAYGDEILGKPKDGADAKRMLEMLSGRVHCVYTGITVRSNEKSVTDCDCTEVIFRRMSEDEIDSYIAGGEPMDKAGAYAIQGSGGRFVVATNGSTDNVIGLPTELLLQILETEFKRFI